MVSAPEAFWKVYFHGIIAALPIAISCEVKGRYGGQRGFWTHYSEADMFASFVSYAFYMKNDG